MDMVLKLLIILSTGLVFGKIFKLLKLPEEIGYLIGGVIIGIPTLNIIPSLPIEELSMFTTFALSFISFLLGLDLNLNSFKKFGRLSIIMSLFIAFTVFLFTTLVIFFITKELPLALILGVIATSTGSPLLASIIEHKRVNNEISNLSTNIAVFDDIVTVILFGIVLMIARSSYGGTLSFIDAVASFKEIILSILLGSIIGLITSQIIKQFKSPKEEMPLIIIIVMGAIALGNYLEISPLLMCTVIGAMITNISKKDIASSVKKIGDMIIPTIFIIFFVVSGIALDFNLIESSKYIIIAYFVARLCGKLIGSNIISRLLKEPKKVSNRIGLTLLPHIGLSIGLSLMIREQIPEIGETVQVVVICAGIIFDFISMFTINFAFNKRKVRSDSIESN